MPKEFYPFEFQESTKKHFWSRVAITDLFSCWEWTGPKIKHGYGRTSFEHENMLAHRMAWIVTFGKIPEGMDVCHKCDNPSCCNPAHLFIGSHYDNMRDMVKKGRCHPPDNKGENNGMSKLNKDQVVTIRLLHKTGASRIELAQKFKVTKSCIDLIVNEIRWRNV